jgi:hypothetical protein
MIENSWATSLFDAVKLMKVAAGPDEAPPSYKVGDFNEATESPVRLHD